MIDLFEHQNYVQPIPPVYFFSAYIIKKAKRDKFLEWYPQKKAENYEYTFHAKLIVCCQDDVNILDPSRVYRNTFLKYGKVCLFIIECMTIACTWLRVLRKNFLRSNKISILPRNGHRLTDTRSFKAIQCLVSIETVLDQRINFAARGI